MNQRGSRFEVARIPRFLYEHAYSLVYVSLRNEFLSRFLSDKCPGDGVRQGNFELRKLQTIYAPCVFPEVTFVNLPAACQADTALLNGRVGNKK